MADYGLTEKGFQPKRLADIVAGVNSRIADQLGIQIETNANSVFGQIIGVFSYEIADLWEQAGLVYNAMYPHTASGISLDNAAALAGIQPIAAEKTTAVCTCYGTQGTQIPYGAQISSATNSNIIFNCVDSGAYIDSNKACDVGVTMASVSVGTAYGVNIDGALYSYTATADDSVASVLTQIAALFDFSDITATVNNDVLQITENDQSETFDISLSNTDFSYIGSPVKFECATAGAVTPALGDLSQIVTVFAGWDSVSNNVAANVGRLAESDTALRQRWNGSLYARSVAMTDSIAAALMTLNGVTVARVYENDSDTTDAEGRPPHSIEAVVAGGDADEIGATIWQKKAAGIDTFGAESVAVTDSQGFAHTINYNRPIPVYVWLDVEITEYPEETLPPDAVTVITEALLTYGDSLTVGNDVILQRFMGAIYQAINGVGYITITAATGIPAGAYSSNNISIDDRHTAEFDAARVSVTIL